MKTWQSPRQMEARNVGATHSRELKRFIATMRRSYLDFQSNAHEEVAPPRQMKVFCGSCAFIATMRRSYSEFQSKIGRLFGNGKAHALGP